MQNNTILWSIILLLTINFENHSGFAKKINLIPSPIIYSIIIDKTSPGLIATLNGQGFITNMPEAHIVYLSKEDSRIKVQALSSSENNLSFQIPAEIEFGDYDISVQIKTRLLKSRISNCPNKLFLRPKAPNNPDLKYNVISKSNEYKNLVTNLVFQGKTLDYALDNDIRIGLNNLRTFYTQNGYESIRSNAASFYYLPEEDFENELEVASELPLKSFAVSKFGLSEDGNRENFDVSKVTNKEIQDLSKHFYLKTPSREKYLERIIKLNPLFIEKVHATEEEFAVITNRSSSIYQLNGCTLADDIKIRFSFGKKDNITAKSSLTVSQNLGLNNTGSDSLTLSCKDIVIDKFSYEKLDANGMAIRI